MHQQPKLTLSHRPHNTVCTLFPAPQIAGHKTSFGSPAWLESHPPASHTAPVIERLLAAGATLIGKTHLDELAFGSNGENEYYGTPVNVAAPGRIPGGSSSGSAVSNISARYLIRPTLA